MDPEKIKAYVALVLIGLMILALIGCLALEPLMRVLLPA
jgi:hypothetical protein